MGQPFATDDAWVVVPHRVLYGDTDAMGIVYYGTWLRFLELGRNEYLRARGGSYREMEARGFRLPVAEVQVRYRAPARYDDELLVATRVDEVRRVSVRFAYEVRRRGEEPLLVTGWSVHACVDAATLKPVPLPPEVTAWLPSPRAPS